MIREVAPVGRTRWQPMGYDERGDGPAQRAQLPQAQIVVIVDLDGTIDVEGLGAPSGPRLFAAGPRLAPIVTGHGGTQRCVEVRLPLPTGAAVLGVSPADVVDGVVQIDDPWTRPLLDPDRGWDERLTAVDDALGRRRAGSTDPLAEHAWARLAHRSVAEVADECGVSRSVLTRRFQRAFGGLSPKVASRLMRFDGAAQLIAAGVPLATVAACAGYHDQSHLHRDALAFAGCTPGEIARMSKTPSG